MTLRFTEKERARFEKEKEAEYFTSLKDDQSMKLLVDEYFQWLDVDPSYKGGSGLTEMFKVLRDALANGESLRDALYARMKTDLDAFLEEGQELGGDIKIAAEYIIGEFFKNPYLVNYDPKFLYMLDFLNKQIRYMGTQRIGPNFQTFFYTPSTDKLIYVYSKLKEPEEISEHDIKRARELFEVAVLANYFNLSFYVQGPNFYNAWEEGAAIARAVHNYIRLPETQGQLCSLIPPTGPTFVDWNKNPWINYPENHHWLTVGLSGVTQIDDRFRA